MGESVYLTRERLLEIEQQVNKLKTHGRRDIAQKIADARAHGDLSENAEYDAAKEEQGLLELKIVKLERILTRAQVIDTSNLTTDEVRILTIVRVKNKKTGKTHSYHLVSPEEADYDNGRLSVTSPIGKELLGKKPGESVKVNVPAGIMEFEILEISK